MACKGWRAKTETLPKEESAMRAIWSTIIISWFSAGIAQPVSELERAIAMWNNRYSEIAYCYGIGDMGSIDEQNREMIRNMLIDPASVWVMYGLLPMPSSNTRSY
jgi:hypothetical protein